MLNEFPLKNPMTKEEYKDVAQELKTELSVLQHQIQDAKLPVIILFEGWGAAGKGTLISDMLQNLDPRSFKVHSTLPPTDEDKRRPWLYRHWCGIPEKGRISILDRSWYPEASLARLEDGLSEEASAERLREINAFEHQLTDDGYLIIKFFLHISQKKQRKRLEKLADNPDTAWRATKLDWSRNKKYGRYCAVFDAMLEATHTPAAPWHILSGQEHYTARYEMYRILTDSIRSALAVKASAKVRKSRKPAAPREMPGFQLVSMPKLAEVTLDKALAQEEYKELLKDRQRQIRELHNRLYKEKVPVIAVYEGWDAAGKGGNIKRLTAALDPRGYEVIPIASPSSTELAHHYLWRFWRALPKDGHVTIFDRTWYGRVMVERIEGFASETEWKRAYREINEFEESLHNWGAVLLKFWLHIDPDEQLRRFQEREAIPEKNWKITAEDWRNRDKWEQYEIAVNDMIRLTSTDFAPWTIIESQDKRYGRIKAMDAFIRAVEEKLD